MIYTIINIICTATAVVQESIIVAQKQNEKNLLKRLDNDLKEYLGDEYISDKKIKKEKKND